MEEKNEQNKEPIIATMREWRDYGSYVWVDYGDGEELAQALEEYGLPVVRVRVEAR